jgi:hypothetical protein
MLITPRPGANRDNLLQALRSVHTSATNEHGRGQPTTPTTDCWAIWSGR